MEQNCPLQTENAEFHAKAHAEALTECLMALYPEAECALQAEGDPFRLLVMAMLSAQCTDVRVNEVAPALFARYSDAKTMSEADIAELEQLIRPCGLYRNKARSIRAMSAMLTEQYGGRVPCEMDELLSLPGVGRKIANLIRGDVYGKGGIVADTHCIRLCGRFGFCETTEKNPERVERILTPLIPTEEQSAFCHRLVLFGREWCSARNPRCAECPARALCVNGRK